MADDKEILEENHENIKPIPSSPPNRKKGFSRAYFGTVLFLMFLFLLLCAIALGSFGTELAQLPRFFEKERELYHIQKGLCMLFVDTRPSADKNSDIKVLIDNLPSNTPCVFIFWGLTSGSILAFVLVIYSLVMLIIASKIVNWLRLVDFLLGFIGSLGFFAFSITLTAGLNKTCSGFAAAGVTCSVSYAVNLSGSRLYFYSSVAAAKNCSWIITIGLLIFSVWNLILVIIYFRRRTSKKQQMASVSNGEFSEVSPLLV